MLLFADSHDHYQTASIGQKYTTVPFAPAVTAAAGSCSSQGLRFTAFSEIVKGLPFATLTGGYGHWLRINLAAVGVQIGLGALGHAGARHLMMYRNYDGSLSVYRNDAVSGLSTVLLGTTAADVIRVSDAYYVEMKSALHNTLGTVTVKVNGVSVLALTNQDTLGAGSTALTSWWMGNESGNGNCEFDIDDTYVFDSAAGEVDDLIGPIRVEFLAPDAAGTYTSDFSLVGAATQHQAVRDLTGNDGDTSYIQSQTIGHQNSNNLQGTGLPAGTIYGVQAVINARVTDAGFRGIKPLLRSGGADYVGAEQYPGFTYRFLHEVFETDPDTAVAWDIAGVNALELGAEVTS